ncbi:KH domain-containing protein HEN4-like isoform X2 [Cornus florida]|uniref:KH domain-containing protein HEN4-like isoform X2 n=1 Tax=Cornus florida TaxID=4283 RepID=UPI0028A28925|nr:KH domain-containing protein HEN4-like isoform X2 [Cornus florida]
MNNPHFHISITIDSGRERVLERERDYRSSMSLSSPTKMQDPTDQSSCVRRPHRDASHQAGAKPLRPPIKLYSGQVRLRLLCHVKTIGGVIGSSGKIIKQLEYDTGAKIKVERTISSCQERVINIIGYPAIYKKITLGEEECEVSQAQEALVRVLERGLEVEGAKESVIVCRLVAVVGQIGAVIGRRGSIVEEIRRNTGAKIWVIPAEQLPACVSRADGLIQIKGDILAVKKALVAVSGCLQDFQPLTDTSSFGDFPDRQTEFPPHRSPSLPQIPGNFTDHSSTDHSLSADTSRIPSPNEESTQQNVVFRLLCSTTAAGGVIGQRGTIIRALQNETGASIKFAPPVAGCEERVVTISGLEKPEPFYFPAQIATIRVFARIMEVSSELGLVSGLSEGEHVSARLLIASNQVRCLIDEGRVASDISTVSGVQIQIVEGDLVPNCAAEYDQVITGEFGNVRSAIFQVTARLRNNLFSSKVFDGAGARDDSNSAISDLSPNGKGEENTSSGLDHPSGLAPFDDKRALTQRMGHPGVLHNLTCPPSTKFLSTQIKSSGNKTAYADSERGPTTSRGRIEHRSVRLAVVTNRVVEVVFPEHVFNSVCGEDGSNLAKVKQISGATVVVQDLCPGASEGKVIISGTAEQTMVAQSLLQAFILTVQ